MHNTRWLIWSIQHNAWWKPAQRGYTQNVGEAGTYSYKQACEIVHGANFHNDGNVPNEAMIRFTDKTLNKILNAEGKKLGLK